MLPEEKAALFGCSGYSMTRVESVCWGGEAVKGGGCPVPHCSQPFLVGPRDGATEDAVGSYVSLGRNIHT